MSRLLRLLKAGARELNRERWQKHVDEAERVLEEHRRRFGPIAAAFAEPTACQSITTRVVKLMPTQLVVSAQLVLDLDLALAHAEALRLELEALASSEIDEARRELLKRRIDEACHRIERRLAIE